MLDATQADVFTYLAEIQNLPQWATEFARELKREGEDYKVVQPTQRTQSTRDTRLSSLSID